MFAAMEGVISNQTQQPQSSAALPVERLNSAVQHQLNLEHVRTRAISLFKAISRILEDFDTYARTNTNPKWQDILGQYSMVNLELFNIVEDIRKVSKAFVVQPKNVNAENATILPVMLSSKLLPEMEMDDNSKKEQLLQGMQNLPVALQIDKLKTRIDMIAAACESAEKVLSDTRKAYGFGGRQAPTITPTLDKAQAAKIQEQENLLRAAVNQGEGLRISGEQRQIVPPLPMHLVDVLNVGDGMQAFDPSGMYQKSNPVQPNNIASQNTLLQASGAQVIGRSVASPSPAASVDTATASPLPYASSPRSGTNMNAPSPQQQSLQQQQHQQQQQQRQKMMQLPHHQQQLLAQQQYRQSAMSSLGQNQLPQLHDLTGQAAQQKFQSLHGQPQMQFSQSLGPQQFQGRQLASGHIQPGIGQSQLSQGMNRQLGQFPGAANSALFNAAQTTQNSQMMPNMSATMSSQTLLPRMQFGLAGTNPQRTHPSQILNDQMFGMGGANPTGMMPMQQQQQQQQHHGNMQQNPQALQANMVALQNNPQNLQGFPQQRQQNQQ